MPELENCYNRGCGQKFDLNNNKDDGCIHHPGLPYFHDAYKGWSCCNKKSVDFTEFLNMKGCTVGKHSNVKPLEPEKPGKLETVEVFEPVQVRTPINIISVERPDFNSPLTKVTPKIAQTLIDQVNKLQPNTRKLSELDDEIKIGTICKNGGCNSGYEGSISNTQDCVHHPGYPVFHEGLKYWSCCTKRTSDFTAFMNQVGCSTGRHKWIKDDDNLKKLVCRYDWHQTAANVVVTIYAKSYHYEQSSVHINPIRLKVKLVFPQEGNDAFNMDLELRRIIDVTKTTVNFLGTKVEIVMPKAEPGRWTKLNNERETDQNEELQKQIEEEKAKLAAANEKNEDESDIDLDDIEPLTRGCTITELD